MTITPQSITDADDTPQITLDDIKRARERIGENVIRTPLVKATRLSLRLGIDLWLKLENLQHTGAFKARGALNKMLSLSDDQSKAGVIACSAGNHAQGVAFHAQRLGVPATIVMPKGTPFNKIQKTEDFGAKVVLHGDSLPEAMDKTWQLAAEKGLAFIHPYDDRDVVAGQGTIGLEMMEQNPDLDTIVVPIGGGGLISGIASAAKAIKPDIDIIGAQTSLYAAVHNRLKGDDDIIGGGTIAEGIAVKEPSETNLRTIKKLVARIDVVNEAEIEDAIFSLLSSEKLVAEGAAGAGLAAIVQNIEKFKGRTTGLVVCGGNIDSRMLSTLILRGLVRDGRITRLRFEIDDTPGQLADISKIIGEEGANVVEVIHQRLMQAVPLKQAELDIVIEARDRKHVEHIVSTLEAKGFKVRTMSQVS